MQDSRLDYLVDKVDAIAKDITEIKVLDAEQNAQLSAHMRRSDLLEKRVEQVDAQLAPLQKQAYMVIGVFKFLAGVAVAVAALEVVLKWLA